MARIKKTTTTNSPVNSSEISADLINAIKAQVIQEMKDEHTRKMEASRIEREKQKKEYDNYVKKMKESSEPWVDVTGWSETDQGVKVSLEWNDSFVDYLRANGVTGADDEQVVQKWVSLLLRDMSDQLEGKDSGEYE